MRALLAMWHIKGCRIVATKAKWTKPQDIPGLYRYLKTGFEALLCGVMNDPAADGSQPQPTSQIFVHFSNK